MIRADQEITKIGNKNCSKIVTNIFATRNQKIVKVISRNILDHLRVDKIFFAQKVVFVIVPLKNTCRNLKYFFMKFVFFHSKKSPSLFSDNKIYVAFLRLRNLDEIVFSCKCLMHNIYYFVAEIF